MAYKAFNEDFFKRMLQAAKAGPINYAFVLDKSKGKHAFALDKSKALSAEGLFKKLRSHAKIMKGSYGTCVVQGGTFILTPEQNVAGLKRALKDLAKQKGWKQKECKLTVPDMEEEDEKGKQGKPEADSGDAPSGTRQTEETAPASSSAGGATATRDESTGEDTETSEATQSSEQAETPEEASAPEDATAADMDGAELEQLAAAVEKGSAAWQKAVKGATRDVKKLEKTVASMDDPRVDAVVQRLRALVKDLPSMDKQLDKFLVAARKKDTKGAAKFKKDLQKAVKACRRFVEEEELIDIAESNPMSRVKLRDPLSKALKLIEKAIK